MRPREAAPEHEARHDRLRNARQIGGLENLKTDAGGSPPPSGAPCWPLAHPPRARGTEGRFREAIVCEHSRMLPTGPPTIETARLRLRPLVIADTMSLNRIQSDRDHMRFYPHPFTLKESRQSIERMQERYARDGFALLAVEDRATDEFLGNVGPKAVLWGKEQPRTHVVYRSDRPRAGLSQGALAGAGRQG